MHGTNLLKRHWLGYLAVWATIFILFAFLYLIARRVIINEIRHHVMGVAIAIAAAIEPASIQLIWISQDADRPEFQKIQRFMDRIQKQNPDVKYIYLMRKSLKPNAKNTDYEYVVDGSPRDENGNGVIDREEMSESPGTYYDAAAYTQLLNAWNEPSADRKVSPDPPYPDLMSGYAPIKDAENKTIAIVGVDVLATTIRMKLRVLQIVMATVWILISLLTTIVSGMYYKQCDLVKERNALVDQLREALGNVKTLAGLLPMCAGCKKIRDDQGYWEQVESYIERHSEAECTHGLCPNCLKNLYPKQYDEIAKQGSGTAHRGKGGGPIRES